MNVLYNFNYSTETLYCVLYLCIIANQHTRHILYTIKNKGLAKATALYKHILGKCFNGMHLDTLCVQIYLT